MAKNVYLYKSSGVPQWNYDELVLQIKPGDRLYFSNGKFFQVGQRIGDGGNTFIYSSYTHPEVAIRIPKAKYWREFINYTVKGYQDLKYSSVETIQVHSSLKGEYAIVERISDQHQSLKKFIHEYTMFEKNKLNFILHWQKTKQLKYQLNELKYFLLNTYEFEYIADLHSENVVYDYQRNKWLLLDWSYPHKFTESSESELTIIGKLFNQHMRSGHTFFMPKSEEYNWLSLWLNQLRYEIDEKRKRQCRSIFLN